MTKEDSHAGGAPHLGINALYAAHVGLAAIDAVRETFRDEDTIRVHPIMTAGGSQVNVIPADVRLEMYVRGRATEGILDARLEGGASKGPARSIAPPSWAPSTIARSATDPAAAPPIA